MRRGEVWLAEVGGKPRPVLVMTRDEVLDVRANVTILSEVLHGADRERAALPRRREPARTSGIVAVGVLSLVGRRWCSPTSVGLVRAGQR
jgi:mRNA-degrading endonuclease toxin of MazEF toxin-antitoxin module